MSEAGRVLWSTKNECDYIRDLLSRKSLYMCPHSIDMDNATLLRNYIRSAKARMMAGTFGDVDSQAAIAYAQQCLDGIEGANEINGMENLA